MATNGVEKPDESHRQLPDTKKMNEVGKLQIKDKDGNELVFSSLYSDKKHGERVLIVFIRHFFCGACEDYIRGLAETLPPETLAQNNITLNVIGCGESQLIPSYAERTGCPYPIYCDPSRAIYTELNMTCTLKGSMKRADYHRRPYYAIVATSMWNAFKSAPSVIQGKAGPSDQNGGEWLFRIKGDGTSELLYCNRMRDTSDHTSLDELAKVLGIQ